MNRMNTASRLLALLLLALMMLSLAACGAKGGDKMDVDVTKTPNHTECIRCGMCIRACPTNAVSFRYGFGDGKKEPVEPANTLKTEETK